VCRLRNILFRFSLGNDLRTPHCLQLQLSSLHRGTAAFLNNFILSPAAAGRNVLRPFQRGRKVPRPAGRPWTREVDVQLRSMLDADAKAGLKRSLGAIYSCANHLRKIAKMKKLLKEFPGPKSPDSVIDTGRAATPRCAAF
jgi:hypothetical protein